ncbi:hypothetical protein BME99_01315 [Pseudomonas protegens]|nr:hypothetical protein BME99_01315 [Pseudomonas protegens]
MFSSARADLEGALLLGELFHPPAKRLVSMLCRNIFDARKAWCFSLLAAALEPRGLGLFREIMYSISIYL